MCESHELVDRFLEEVNGRGLDSEAWTDGKYDVSRLRLLDPRMADLRMPEGTTEVTKKIRLLDAG